MTVFNLIKELQKLDPTSIVCTVLENFKEEGEYSIVEIEGVRDPDHLPGDQRYFGKFTEYWDDTERNFKSINENTKLTIIDI